MRHHHRRAFSMMELLIAIAIIVLLVGLAIPAFSGAKRRSGVVRCIAQANQIGTAMTLYVKDNRGYYPQGVNEWTVIGGATEAIASTRPLGRYTSNNIDLARCPLDGVNSSGSSTCYQSNGSSYMYADSDNYTNMNVFAGIVAVEGHRDTEFVFPSAKAVVYDRPIATNSNATSKTEQWHNKSEPLKGGMAFADGHAAEVERKAPTGTNWTGTGCSAADGSNSNASPSQVEALRGMAEGFY